MAIAMSTALQLTLIGCGFVGGNTLSVSPTSTSSSKCSTNKDCELLGTCTNGVCQCSPGFTGDTCGQLSLKPIESLLAARIWPLDIETPKTASWGFSSVKGDDDLYHGVVNVGCGASATGVTGTYAAMISSAEPDKGFKFQSMLTPPTSFNPHLIRSPNGTYMLYFRVNDLDNHSICTGDPSVKDTPSPQIKSCQMGQHPSTDNCVVPGSPDGEGINMYVAWADSPAGPWKSTNVSITGCGNFHKSNPTTVFLKDGRVMLSYRFNYKGEMVAFAIADDFRGPFKSVANLSHDGGNDEDSFIWQQQDGSLHILYHNEAHGRHAFSNDTGATWSKGVNDAFVLSYNLTDGTSGTFNRRERPEILFENGMPVVFYTAVQNKDGTSMSFVQQFETSN